MPGAATEAKSHNVLFKCLVTGRHVLVGRVAVVVVVAAQARPSLASSLQFRDLLLQTIRALSNFSSKASHL